MDDADQAHDMDEAKAMDGADEMQEPAAVEVIEETIEEIIVVPATVSEDAPTEPHMGEDASPSQPQPVYPDEAMDGSEDMDEPAVLEVIEETMEAIIAVPATVSEDAPTEPHMGEDPSPSQPQPVYPGGGMDGGSMAPAGDDAPSSQPQPVYPDGMPDGL
jgi:cytochrome c